MAESTAPSHSIDPTQFGGIVQHQFLHVVNGRDPLSAAAKIEAGWFRLDPISTALESDERNTQVFENALEKGVEVMEEAARESHRKQRKSLGELALSLKVDAIQVGLTLPNSEKGTLVTETGDMLAELRDKEKRTLREGREITFNEMFDIINIKALNVQAQAENARQTSPFLKTAATSLAQASLGGLIQECTGYLRRVGSIYSERRSKQSDASLQSGRFTELAIFTKRLLDWYDAGITEGDSVRLTVSREDRPRLARRRDKENRRSFDIVTRNIVDHADVTLIQVKSSDNLGGPKYDEPIKLWHPSQSDIAENADNIAAAFETIVANEDDAEVRTARLRLAQFLG